MLPNERYSQWFVDYTTFSSCNIDFLCKTLDIVADSFNTILPFEQEYYGNVLIMNSYYLESKSPITIKTNPVISNIIFLSIEDCKYIGQVVYQLSHEIAHVLMNSIPRDVKIRWIGEVFASLSSFVILKLAANQPFKQDVFERYLTNNVISKIASTSSIKEWVNKNYDNLINPYSKELAYSDWLITYIYPISLFIYNNIIDDFSELAIMCMFRLIDMSRVQTYEDFFKQLKSICENSIILSLLDS